MRSFLFFVEGVHDINCVARILLINGFKERSEEHTSELQSP